MAGFLDFLSRSSLNGVNLSSYTRQVLIDAFETTGQLTVRMARLLTNKICPFSDAHIKETVAEIKASKGDLLGLLYFFDALKTHTMAHLLAHVTEIETCDVIYYWAYYKFPIDVLDKRMLANAAWDSNIPEHNRRVLFSALTRLD